MAKKTLNVADPGHLAYLAAIVAIEAPLKQGHAFAAYIPWDVIHKIREALDEAGWPWRATHEDARRRKEQARQDAHAEREALERS